MENVEGPAGPAGSQGAPGMSDSSVGNIQGQVQLYDVYGSALADNSGASVLIEHSVPLIVTTTAADGSFTLPSVHSGNYDLDVQKPGYGTMRLLNFPHPGGTTSSQTGVLTAGQQLDSQFNIRLIVDTSSNGGSNFSLVITVKLAHPQITSNPVLLFFRDSPNVTNANSLYIFRSNFFQQDDSTLVFSPFDTPLGQFSDRLGTSNTLYISAALDNVRSLFYINESGISIYPCAGILSNEVQVFNVLKN